MKRHYDPHVVRLRPVDGVENRLFVDISRYLGLRICLHDSGIIGAVYYPHIVKGNEVFLNLGRFRKFNKDKWWGSCLEISDKYYIQGGNSILNWIEENIHDEWTFSFMPDNLPMVTTTSWTKVIFSFKSDADTMHFILRWK